MKLVVAAVNVTLISLISITSVTVVNCREAIKPPADVAEVGQLFEGLNLDAIGGDAPPCTLDIQRDLPKPSAPQPLYLIPGTEEFWLPNAQGLLEVPRGTNIELYCTRSFANVSNVVISPSTKALRLTCLQGTTFTLQGSKHEFSQLQCSQPTKYSVERLPTKCAQGGGTLYRVGFNISQSGRFVETLKMCHDDATLRTFYSKYTLQPANLHFQRFVKRLNFSKAGHFKDINMNFLYSQHNQREQAIAQLDENHLHLFDNRSLYLSRGHLAAKADFIYASQQRATFTFFNAAPQWQSFNGGQWGSLEDEVRKFVARARLVVECYTGTWGTLQLPSASGKNQEFYLAYDANNNGLLPVPQLYYRVIVDRGHPGRGIALVGVNNPHATINEIHETYLICDDVREQVPWLRWIRNNNLKKGYIYACRVEDFVSVVQDLPAHLSAVNELLI